MSSAADGDLFFTSGGEDLYSDNKKIDIYNGKTRQWSSVPLSIPRSKSVVAVLKGKVFVGSGKYNMISRCRVDIYDMASGKSTFELFGDFEYDHRSFVATVADRYVVFNDYRYFYVYDIQKSSWETIDIPITNRVVAQDMVAVGSKLYMNDFHEAHVMKVYDLENRKWSRIITQEDISNIKMLALDDKLYFYGNVSGVVTKVIDVMDIKTESFTKILLPHEKSTYTMTAEPKSGSLVVSGGTFFGRDVNDMIWIRPSDDLLVYNLGKKTWASSKLRGLRLRHVAEFINGQFIVHGGQNEFQANLPTEIYNVALKAIN